MIYIYIYTNGIGQSSAAHLTLLIGTTIEVIRSSCRSDEREEKESNDEEDGKQENKKGVLRKREKFKLSVLLGGWFSYFKFTSAGRRKHQAKTSKSKLATGLLVSFRKMVRIYNKKSSSEKELMGDSLVKCSVSKTT